MDHNIGKKLDGRYEISELIGIGGMADVYKAIDIMEDKIVAIKILKTEFAGNEDFLRRFRNESKAIAVLSHPNIVKIFDVGFTDKIQFIVMEFIDGITLKEFIEQQGILKWKDAIHFTTQILRALQHAHDRGIVHRDIKPQNIMLFPDGTIKVMDFGIARFAREEGKTLSDKTIGSVHYISPEQARGDITDEKSDIYSVGSMLYEMLTGQKPFDAETPVAVALMHMQEIAKSPRDIINSIPASLEEIVMHAMQKDATKRYQSASEMIKDIESFKQNQSIVFGYNNINNNLKVAVQNSGSTIYFKPLTKSSSQTEDVIEEEDGYEDEEEEPSHLIVPILTGVTVVVVIVAAVFIAILLLKDVFKTQTATFTMPNLVGIEFQTAKYDNPDLILNSTEEYNTEYEEGIIFYQDKAEGRTFKKGETIKVNVSKGPRMIDMPDVINVHYDVAKSSLEQNDLIVATPKYKFDDNIVKDYVISADYEKNTLIPAGTEITLFVSKGPADMEIKVPYVLEMTEKAAVDLLNEYKLTPKVEYIDDITNAGMVISQDPAKDKIVNRGSEVIIYVSSGEQAISTVTLSIAIPSESSGKYNLNFLVEGSIIKTETIDEVAYIANSFKKVAIQGSGQQTIVVEIRNLTTNKSKKYATYLVDFDKPNETPERTYVDIYAFQDTAKSDTVVTTTPAETTTNPLETYPDYPDYPTTSPYVQQQIYPEDFY